MSDLSPPSSMSSDRTRPMVVLLVDDQAFVGVAVRFLLASEPDIELHCCTEAVNAITIANQIHPAVVLQDLVMPGIDGLTLVRSFHENPATATTPVIILSGSDDADTRRRALAAGARGFLVKLPPKAELIACLHDHGSWREPPANTLDRAVIDGLLEAGAPDFTRRLITQFLEEAADAVRTLNDAAGRGDAPVLRATAHRLRGSAMIMGASRLAALCARTEDQDTHSSELATSLLTDIDDELLCVQQALLAERDRM